MKKMLTKQALFFLVGLFLAPGLAWPCDAPTSTSFSPLDSSLNDWSNSTYCMWQSTDASGDQGTAGVDILGFGVTHTEDVANNPNHFWFIRLRGAPVNNRTYRVQFNNPGEVINMNMTCDTSPPNGPRDCALTCTLNGQNATCQNNTIRAYQLTNGEWAIELMRQSTQLFFDLVDGSTFAAYTLNGNTVLDSTTPIPAYSSTNYNTARAAQLTSLEACVHAAGTEIRWETRTERETIGFRVRRDAPDGPVVDRMVQGTFTSPHGGRYQVLDHSVGSSYYLEEISPRSSRTYGPARPRQGCAARPPVPVSAIQTKRLATHSLGMAVQTDNYSHLTSAGAYELPCPEEEECMVALDGRPLPIGFAGRPFFFAAQQQAFDRPDNAYHLTRGTSPAMASRSSLSSDTPAGSAKTVLRLAEHRLVNALAPAELRFPWTYAFSGADPASVVIPLPRHAGGGASLVVSVSGMSDFHLPDQHRAVLSVGGVAVADEIFGGTQEKLLLADLSADAVGSGGFTLELKAIANGKAPYDIVALNYVEVRYLRSLIADSDNLIIEDDAQAGFVVEGFSKEPVILDITDPLSPVMVEGTTPADGGPGRVAFREAVGFRRYWIGPLQALPNIRPTHPLKIANADYVVVYGEGLESGLQPLLDLRRHQGRKVLAVSMQQVADTFDNGQRSPEALRRFFEAMRERGLRDALLVGTASIDPGNLMGTGKEDLVPTHVGVARPFGSYAVNDSWLVRKPGEYRPFASIGRLPVADAAALEEMVAKILSYEEESSGRRAVFAADAINPLTNEPDSTFVNEIEGLAQRLSLYQIERVYRPESGHAELMAALGQFPDLVVFSGHGSGWSWTTGDLLTSAPGSSQLTELPQGHPFLLVTASCWDGQFAAPDTDSLSQSLVALPQGGAIGAIAASSLAGSEAQQAFLSALASAMLAPENQTVGEMWLQVQKELGVGEFDAIELAGTYNLIGDPGTRLPDRMSATFHEGGGCQSVAFARDPVALAMINLFVLAFVLARRRRNERARSRPSSFAR